jgi:hypothetical protein
MHIHHPPSHTHTHSHHLIVACALLPTTPTRRPLHRLQTAHRVGTSDTSSKPAAVRCPTSAAPQAGALGARSFSSQSTVCQEQHKRSSRRSCSVLFKQQQSQRCCFCAKWRSCGGSDASWTGQSVLFCPAGGIVCCPRERQTNQYSLS